MTIKKIMLLLTLGLSFGSTLWTSVYGYYDEWLFLSLIGLLAAGFFWERRETVEQFRFSDSNFMVATGGWALALIILLAVIQRITDPYHFYAADNPFLIAVFAIIGFLIGACTFDFKHQGCIAR
ncbi:MAG: hypothetical protein P4L53_03765 [Candidatus Obscuribacterales bacterium]|nr:hypothetical protein [Candidatus Obscuribacterales bacterium]